MWLFSRKMWGAERQGSRREVVAGATSNTVEVAAGEVLTVEVRVAAETARVSWTFSTEENNIGFEASFRTEPAGQAPPEGDDVQEHEGDATADAGGDNDELEVVPFSRVESQVLPQHGSFTNTGSQGILTLTFDNSFSHYRCAIHANGRSPLVVAPDRAPQSSPVFPNSQVEAAHVCDQY